MQNDDIVTKYLGKQHSSPIDTLEVIASPHRGMRVVLSCNEFTSHCPVTSQPDFATLVIDYVVDEHIVETKSLKLWLWSWRERRAFNEDVVATIAAEFFAQVKPQTVTVSGMFAPRGGIAVSPSCTVTRT